MAVSVDDIIKTLDISTYNIVEICSSDKINGYSKHCPIYAGCIDASGNWSKYNYGIYISNYTSLDEIASYINTGTVPSAWSIPTTNIYDLPLYDIWKKRRPVNDNKSLYRLGDFDGYNHDETGAEIFAASITTSETAAAA